MTCAVKSVFRSVFETTERRVAVTEVICTAEYDDYIGFFRKRVYSVNEIVIEFRYGIGYLLFRYARSAFAEIIYD